MSIPAASRLSQAEPPNKSMAELSPPLRPPVGSVQSAAGVPASQKSTTRWPGLCNRLAASAGLAQCHQAARSHLNSRPRDGRIDRASLPPPGRPSARMNDDQIGDARRLSHLEFVLGETTSQVEPIRPPTGIRRLVAAGATSPNMSERLIDRLARFRRAATPEQVAGSISRGGVDAASMRRRCAAIRSGDRPASRGQ